MRDGLLPLPDIEMAMRDPNADHAALRAIERDVRNELLLLRCDAEIALDGDLHADMRLALLAYLSSVAHLHGRTKAQQLAVFMADRDELFAALMFRALGVAIA